MYIQCDTSFQKKNYSDPWSLVVNSCLLAVGYPSGLIRTSSCRTVPCSMTVVLIRLPKSSAICWPARPLVAHNGPSIILLNLL